MEVKRPNYYIEVMGRIEVIDDKGTVHSRYLPGQYALTMPLHTDLIKFLGLPELKPEVLSEDEKGMIQRDTEVEQQEETKQQEFKKDLRREVESEGQVSKQEFEQITKQKVSDEEFAPPKGFRRLKK